MRALLTRYRPHVGLVITRLGAVILFCLASVVVAGVYISDFLLSVLVGVIAGVALGLLNDFAAVAYGRRSEHIAIAAHLERQAISRAAAEQRAAMAADLSVTGGGLGAARHNEARDRPITHEVKAGGRPVPGMGGVALAAAFGVAGAATGPAVAERAAAHGLTRADVSEVLVDADEAIAIRRLCELMLGELRATDLIGQQGRGVIQLAHQLGDQVPALDAETVTAYVSDHVLVAAGQQPEHPERWGGALDEVRPLVLAGDAGGDLLGLVVAAEGRPVTPVLDEVVHVLVHSNGGLGLGQVGFTMRAHGHPISPYTLAVVLKHLVDLGRVERTDGGRYRLTRAEWAARKAPAAPEVDNTGRPPLDVVYSVLRGGPAGGMTLGEVAEEVTRRREIRCTHAGAATALDALVRSHRAGASDGRFVAREHPGLISGPGLRERIRTAVAAYDEQGGATAEQITEVVDADGFGAGIERVRAMAEQLRGQGDLVMADDRYQSSPF